jgi:hypothetical protein
MRRLAKSTNSNVKVPKFVNEDPTELMLKKISVVEVFFVGILK